MTQSPFSKWTRPGFTLAELLIALVILGVIATFTIPKVLQSQQSSQYKSAAKEVAGMISGAYQAYGQRNTPVAATTAADLTPYMNYVAVDTTGVLDDIYTNGTATCNPASARWCLKLHNGGSLMYFGFSFGNTATTNGLYFNYDPDGKVTDGTTNGPGKALQIWLYYNGRMTTQGGLLPNSYTSNGNAGGAAPDQPWFSWS